MLYSSSHYASFVIDNSSHIPYIVSIVFVRNNVFIDICIFYLIFFLNYYNIKYKNTIITKLLIYINCYKNNIDFIKLFILNCIINTKYEKVFALASSFYYFYSKLIEDQSGSSGSLDSSGPSGPSGPSGFIESIGSIESFNVLKSLETINSRFYMKALLLYAIIGSNIHIGIVYNVHFRIFMKSDIGKDISFQNYMAFVDFIKNVFMCIFVAL
jgi:hypothetical protein